MLGQAASVEESDDKLTWTFTLRDDITWSDGQAVTAADFVFGFDNLAAQGGDYFHNAFRCGRKLGSTG